MDEVERVYSCNLCVLEFVSHGQYIEHINTDSDHEKKHNAALYKALNCQKCDVQFEDRRAFDRHCLGKKHIEGHYSKEDLYCNKCNTQCQNKAKWDQHLKTKKHLNEEPKLTEEELYCNKCHTQCHNKSEWDKHIQTKKHTIERFTEKKCDACNIIILNKISWEQHHKTKKHLRNTNTNAEGISGTVFETCDKSTQSD
jgi:hypothetical protein